MFLKAGADLAKLVCRSIREAELLLEQVWRAVPRLADGDRRRCVRQWFDSQITPPILACHSGGGKVLTANNRTEIEVVVKEPMKPFDLELGKAHPSARLSTSSPRRNAGCGSACRCSAAIAHENIEIYLTSTNAQTARGIPCFGAAIPNVRRSPFPRWSLRNLDCICQTWVWCV